MKTDGHEAAVAENNLQSAEQAFMVASGYKTGRSGWETALTVTGVVVGTVGLFTGVGAAIGEVMGSAGAIAEGSELAEAVETAGNISDAAGAVSVAIDAKGCVLGQDGVACVGLALGGLALGASFATPELPVVLRAGTTMFGMMTGVAAAVLEYFDAGVKLAGGN